MKTFNQFIFDLQEVVKQPVVQAAARQQYQSQAVKQKIDGSQTRNVRGGGTAPPAPGTKPTPPKIKNNLVYHGTTKPASQSISKSGWRTDKNVTRQMSGSGVYVTPQKPAAQMYAKDRSNQRGEKPAVRTLSIPSSKYQAVKSNRQRTGQWTANKGGQKFNFMQVSPQGANKYDITDKSRGQTIRPQGSQKAEIKQRVNTALKKPQNRSALRAQSGMKPRGGGSSAQGVGSSSGTSRYQVGGGQGYGISGIKLADSYDLYDIILSHLLDEGYAETPESAEVIMANMSEEWVSTILEAHPLDDERVLRQNRIPYIQRSYLKSKPRKKTVGN